MELIPFTVLRCVELAKVKPELAYNPYQPNGRLKLTAIKSWHRMKCHVIMSHYYEIIIFGPQAKSHTH